MADSRNRRARMLAFVAPSGTGKTTLLKDVVSMLVGRGTRLSVLKASHEDHDLDVAGKDTWRFQRAGAPFVGLFGPEHSTFFLAGGHGVWPGARAVADWVAACPFAPSELVLCEGFSFDCGLPKLRVVRGAWPDDPDSFGDLVAVAWDGEGRPQSLPDGVDLLPLEAEAVAAWIEAWL